MITDMNLWTDVRRDVLVGGLSKRQACKKYNIHFKTLQKILQHTEPPGYRATAPRPKTKIGPFIPIIHEILEADKKAPRKQRHTGKRIFERLRDEHGYEGKITVVRDEIRRWKASTAEVFMPLSHPPGEAQVDFGEATVIYRGHSRKVAFIEVTLPYSGAVYCQAFPRECTETFQEGHRRAFEFFGGVPTRISFDNSKIAVARIVGGRGQDPTREFRRLQSHYLFEEHFCRVRRPNEKGHVENGVGSSRRNFMVPVPQFDDFEEFNRHLEECCRKDLERILRGQTSSKGQLLQEERQMMLPLPGQPFEARRIELPKANTLSLVRFDRNDYSVPVQYAHRKMTAVGGIDRVRLVADNHVIAEHVRDWDRENVHYDPVHYLALLERKPGALDYARPLEEWDLPDSIRLLRRRLEQDAGNEGRREFIKILRLLETFSMRELQRAVVRALEINTTEVTAIRIFLESGREETVRLFSLDGRPHLQGHSIPEPHIHCYNDLTEYQEKQP